MADDEDPTQDPPGNALHLRFINPDAEVPRGIRRSQLFGAVAKQVLAHTKALRENPDQVSVLRRRVTRLLSERDPARTTLVEKRSYVRSLNATTKLRRKLRKLGDDAPIGDERTEGSPPSPANLIAREIAIGAIGLHIDLWRSGRAPDRLGDTYRELFGAVLKRAETSSERQWRKRNFDDFDALASAFLVDEIEIRRARSGA